MWLWGVKCHLLKGDKSLNSLFSVNDIRFFFKFRKKQVFRLSAELKTSNFNGNYSLSYNFTFHGENCTQWMNDAPATEPWLKKYTGSFYNITFTHIHFRPDEETRTKWKRWSARDVIKRNHRKDNRIKLIS